MFDYDGVIVDSLEVFHTALAAVCAAHGCPALADRETFLRLFDTNMVEGLRAAGLPTADLVPVLTELGARLTAGAGGYSLFPGMAEALRRLTDAGPVYVITSNLTAVVAAFLRQQRIRGITDILGSDKEPSKQRKIRQIVSKHPDATHFYVGDTLGDMLEARAAGVRPVAVTWGWHTPERLAVGHPALLATSPQVLVSRLLG